MPRTRKTGWSRTNWSGDGTMHWSESRRLSHASRSTSTVMIGPRPLPARSLKPWRVNWSRFGILLKRSIVRTLIEEIVVDVDAEAGELILIIHWKGGVH